MSDNKSFNDKEVDKSTSCTKSECSATDEKHHQSTPTTNKDLFIYQLKIELLDIEPVIWRRILIPSKVTLGELHHILQDVMGWKHAHYHQFNYHNGERPVMFINAFNLEFQQSMGSSELYQDEAKVVLSEILKKENDRLFYLYDMGDDWTHAIRLEAMIEVKEDKVPIGPFPTCLGGARACPPEDCGGTSGYQYLLEILAAGPDDANRDEYENMIDWLHDSGYGDFDPEKFDPTQMIFFYF